MVHDGKLFACWQKGLTGYPIIDAGMRELWATGYMHNRVRMIAASFLTRWSRYLVIDLVHPWTKSTRKRAKCFGRDCPASVNVCSERAKRLPPTMTLRLHKDLLRIPSGWLGKSQPIADYRPRSSTFHGLQRRTYSLTGVWVPIGF